jgi:hypothetical protein
MALDISAEDGHTISANHGPKAKNVLMDGHKVDDVARFAPVGHADALFVARSAGCST